MPYNCSICGKGLRVGTPHFDELYCSASCAEQGGQKKMYTCFCCKASFTLTQPYQIFCSKRCEIETDLKVKFALKDKIMKGRYNRE